MTQKKEILVHLQTLDPNTPARMTWSKERLEYALLEARALDKTAREAAAAQTHRNAIHAAHPFVTYSQTGADLHGMTAASRLLNRTQWHVDGVVSEYKTLRSLILRYAAIKAACGTVLSDGTAITPDDVDDALTGVLHIIETHRNVEILEDVNRLTLEAWGRAQKEIDAGRRPASLDL